mgnify:CR=1 FL=1
MKVNLDQFCNGRIYRIDEIAYKLDIDETRASFILCTTTDYDVEVLYYGDAGYFYRINKI